MRVALGLIVIEFPTAYASDPADYLRKGLALRDRYGERPAGLVLPRAARALHGVRRDASARSARSPRSSTCRCTSTCTRPTTRSRARWPSTACARSSGCGGSGWSAPSLIAVHAVHLDDAEIELLGAARLLGGALPVVQPEARQRLRAGRRHAARRASTSRSAPTARRATTGSTCSQEMRTAALLAKAVARQTREAMPAHAALRAATLGGAQRARPGRAHRLDRAGQGGRPGRGRPARRPSSRPATTRCPISSMPRAAST